MTDERSTAIRVADQLNPDMERALRAGFLPNRPDYIVPLLLAEIDRLRAQVLAAANEGRNVLPDATDDQAAVIEAWAAPEAAR